MTSYSWPSNGEGVSTYASLSNFPSTAGNGELALALDTDTLYTYNTGSHSWVAIANPAAGTGITALTGDVTATGPGSAVATLKTVNASPGSFGSASASLSATVNAKGLITALSSQSIQIAESQVTNLVTDLAAKVNTSSLGNLTDVGTDGITVTGGTGAVVGNVSFSQHVADSTHNGYLSSTDWNTFNNKQATVSFGAFGSTPNANGGSIAAGVITLQPADASNPGGLSTGAQTIPGAKTFAADTTYSGNIIYTPTVNSSLTGANARIPSHVTSNLVFTNASLTSIGSANNGGVTGGHTLQITNETGSNLTIVNNYGSAAAGEAIYTGANADIIIPTHSTIWMQYNGTASAWVVMAPNLKLIGTIDSQTKSANAAVQSGNTLYLQSADASFPGVVTTGAQTFAGVKTFNSAPILNSLSVSQAVFTDASKNLVSNAITGSGSVVMSGSPTLTGTAVIPNINAGAATSLVLQSAGTTALTLDTSQNATFAGTVNSNSGATNVWGTGGTGSNSPALRLNGGTASGAGPYIQFQKNSVTIGDIGATSVISGGTSNDISIYANTGQVILASNGTTALTLDTSQNATFVGTPNVTPTTGTAHAYGKYNNTGGSLYVGLDDSTGASFANGAYSSALYSSANTAMGFYTNGTHRFDIAANGDVNIYQTGAKTGALTGALTIGDPSTLTNGTGIYMRTSGEASFSTASSTGFFTFYNNSTQYMKIAANGVITFANLAGSGSRAVNADASGNLSAASDSRLKTEVEAPIPGLSEILKLEPKAYKWNSDIEQRGEQAAVEIGFFANDVAPIIPSAAPMGQDGYYGFYDRSVIAALVKAVQQLKAEIDELKKG